MVAAELSTFIRLTFRSVWSLELLLFLRAHGERSWSRPELVTALRASDLVIVRGVDALLAAGLILIETDERTCYRPLSPDLDRLVEEVEVLYARSPDAVRRAIIAPSAGGLAAFADAFRLRKD